MGKDIQHMTISILFIAIVLAVITSEAITQHVTKHDIFLKIRQLPYVGTLTSCPVCFGQWSAWFSTGLWLFTLGVELSIVFWLTTFLAGFIVYRLANVFHDTVDYIYNISLDKKID